LYLEYYSHEAVAAARQVLREIGFVTYRDCDEEEVQAAEQARTAAEAACQATDPSRWRPEELSVWDESNPVLRGPHEAWSQVVEMWRALERRFAAQADEYRTRQEKDEPWVRGLGVLAAATRPGADVWPETAKAVAALPARCKQATVGLVRCVFGNPFRPIAIESALRTPDVLRLAEAADEERSLPSGHFDNARLAVLADALEEAGASGPLLEHLRSPGPHVRGCHALDAILGKA
jgi:hypothetical protein